MFRLYILIKHMVDACDELEKAALREFGEIFGSTEKIGTAMSGTLSALKH